MNGNYLNSEKFTFQAKTTLLAFNLPYSFLENGYVGYVGYVDGSEHDDDPASFREGGSQSTSRLHGRFHDGPHRNHQQY